MRPLWILVHVRVAVTKYGIFLLLLLISDFAIPKITREEVVTIATALNGKCLQYDNTIPFGDGVTLQVATCQEYMNQKWIMSKVNNSNQFTVYGQPGFCVNVGAEYQSIR